ncbi:MAG TPA: AAA family ATPase [Blastocatellia bacterium]|nr:AAA family ATPase [Blastocatellia bacterium]
MEKDAQQFANGMILGKFMPPHRGHQLLIDFARERVAALTILVCSLEREPIPGRLRYEWMKEMYPEARVVHVTDENPQEPHEHPRFWEIWTATVRRHIPTGPEVVFTSESYGDELARWLGARHILVDLARQRVPVSATAIRRDPFANWQFIPECVRPYFVKRVAIVGAESTGKTTLARQLAAHYQTSWVPEFARQYLDLKDAERPLAALTFADITEIARGQLTSEARLARQANRVLICDTELLTTRLWSEHFFGTCEDWIERATAERRYDLYLLTGVDVAWVADPHRDAPQLREQFTSRLRRELESRERRCVMISGAADERLRRAIAAIDSLF